MPTFEFFCTEPSKVSSISMKRKHLRVSITFGLGPAPRTFTKLLKSPIAVLRRIQIRTIIYLEDMLLMSQTINGLEIARDTFIFILQSLGLVTNSQKSVLVPLQKVRVSRVGNRLSESDINTTTGKKN